MSGARGVVAAFVLLQLLGLAQLGESVTPVQKVVELLKNLEAKVEKEGKEEAAAYDKYACFCKEQVDDKLYAIEKSTAKIEKLAAEIKKLGSEISDLDNDIKDLGKKISDLEKESKDAQKERDGEHEDYVTKEADASGAMDASTRAIAALKESKGGMGGKTELEALVQVRSIASLALGFASRVALSDAQLRSLAALSEPGAANEYKYHSNDIIATIESLLASFTNIKAGLDQDEFDANARHDKKQLGLKNEIKFAEKEKAEKVSLREDKTDEKEAKEADKTQETSDKNADQSFMDVLRKDCETKAQLWDQRSSTRAQELTTMSEAMDALEKGVAPNWKANKKLVGLQQSTRLAPVTGHWVYVEEAARPAASSFVQLQLVGGLRGGLRGRAGREAAAAEKVRALLQSSGERLKSPLLAAAALKVSVAEDHFVKVRQIIKDLVARLEQQAKDEADQKTFCDEQMKAAVEKRDQEQSEIEDLAAQITAKEAEKAQLKEAIAELSKQIASLKKALKEATELRQKEKTENEQTIEDAGAGKEAVENALEVLKKFYEGAAFVQRSRFVPTDSDREGLTVADRAPEVFDSEYKGSQDASKGIIGMLEVILSDFDRTGTTVTGEESDAQGDFDEFKTENEKDTGNKETSVDKKEGEVTNIEDKLVQLEDSKKTAKEGLEDAEKSLEELHSMCVAGEETYEERVAKREKEIEALKEAHGILEDWSK